MYGFIREFIKDAGSATGYRVKMLVDGVKSEVRTFDVTEAVFKLQFEPRYKFPLIGEYLFAIITDAHGVVTELADTYKSHCKAVYSFGSPKTIASVVRIGDGYIEFTDFAKQFAEGRLVYYDDYKKMGAKPVEKGTRIALSKNLTLYCLDWTKDETTFSRVDMAYLKSVLGVNTYWMTIFNLYGDNEEFDVITFTLNYWKDPESLLGDLAKLHMSREQLTKPQKK